MMEVLKLLLAVGLGSGVGGMLRMGVSLCFGRLNIGGSFPWSTLIANVAGCFIIGMVYGLATRENSLSPTVKLLLTTGLCGGLTTFSTFSFDNFALLEQRQWLVLALNISVSITLGMLAAFGGYALTAQATR